MVSQDTPKEDVRRATMVLYDNDASRTASQKTFPIIGIVRGGTTAVAGCMRKMGLNIGSNLPNNLEDPDFSHGPSVNQELVAGRNAAHPVWGWKFPHGANYIERIFPRLRNPRFVVVTRDLAANGLAIAARHGDQSLEDALEISLKQTRKNHDLVLKLRQPTLMLSYEKLILKPEQTIAELAEFMDVELTEQLLEDVMGWVTPGRYSPTDHSLPK